MRALVVYAHPSPESFSAAILQTVCDTLNEGAAEVTVLDLYAEGFQPILGRGEWDRYLDGIPDDETLRAHVEALKAADTLIFVYPTWWYGLPAILKGWLDRVLLPGVAFDLPPEGDIVPTLRHITRLGVFTTCGASWLLTRFVSAPGRRTLLRGVGILCAPRRRVAFAAHYSMDTSTPVSRARHLRRVERETRKLVGRRRGGGV